MKILFVKLNWFKILKDPLEEDSPIVAPIHILFIIRDSFVFYIYLFWKFHVFSLNGWKVWILKDLIEGSPILVPEINFVFPWYLPLLKIWCV